MGVEIGICLFRDGFIGSRLWSRVWVSALVVPKSLWYNRIAGPLETGLLKPVTGLLKPEIGSTDQVNTFS